MSAIGNQAPVSVPPPDKTSSPSADREGRSGLWKWLILLGIVGGSIAGYELWLKPRRAAEQAAKTVVSVRTAKVTRGPLVRTVRLTGQTSARNYANIIAPLLRGPESGRDLILMKLVKSGAYVKKGDLLAEIDAQSSRDHIDDTQDLVRQAENDVKQRQASQLVEWEALQQSVRVAKADLDKWTWEAKASEIRTALDQELIKLQVEESAARYRELQQDLESKKASMAAEIRILEITLIRQRRHLERHVVDIKKFEIRSPMDGLAVMQSIWRGSDMNQIQEGDRVSPGQPFMKVVNQNSMQVDASMNQAEVGDFKVGLPAEIGLDAFPGLTFKGKIYSIGALAAGGWRSSFYIRNVPVRFAITGSDPRLIPDLSAYGNVEIERQDDALLAPLGTIRTKGDKSYVVVKTPQGFEDREVEVGMANNTHASIVSGLKEGEELRLD